MSRILSIISALLITSMGVFFLYLAIEYILNVDKGLGWVGVTLGSIGAILFIPVGLRILYISTIKKNDPEPIRIPLLVKIMLIVLILLALAATIFRLLL